MAELSSVDYFMASHANKLPYDSLAYVRNQLYELPDQQVRRLCDTLAFKEPSILLAISLCLGILGVDRFMLNQTGLGVVKLLTFGGCGIWAIIDWFLVLDETKKYNYSMLINAISNGYAE